ncbi:MAG: hypothetical protein RRY21_00985 [Oscillospiraceae bacterium]
MDTNQENFRARRNELLQQADAQQPGLLRFYRTRSILLRALLLLCIAMRGLGALTALFYSTVSPSIALLAGLLHLLLIASLLFCCQRVVWKYSVAILLFGLLSVQGVIATLPSLNQLAPLGLAAWAAQLLFGIAAVASGLYLALVPANRRFADRIAALYRTLSNEGRVGRSE